DRREPASDPGASHRRRRCGRVQLPGDVCAAQDHRRRHSAPGHHGGRGLGHGFHSTWGGSVHDRRRRDSGVPRRRGCGRGPRGRSGQGGGQGMKLIVAIVRPDKVSEVLEALYRAEVRGLSVSRIQGHGGELERVETYRGTTVKVGLTEKVRFEIGVSDHFVEPTVRAIMSAARTGEVGDGKIFVLPVEKIYRIRTGEEDTAAVTPVAAVGE